MSLKERIKEYFSNLKSEEKEAVKEAAQEAFNESQKFEDVTLADGNVVMIEPSVEVGAAVAIAMDGEIAPVQDGSHELEDGRTIVTEGGIIVEVIEPAAEETPEAPAVEEDMNEMPSPKSVIERTEIEKKFSAMNEEIETLKEAFNSYKENAEKEVSSLSKDLEEAKDKYKKLMDFAAVEPVKTPKTSQKVNNLKTFRQNLRTGAKK